MGTELGCVMCDGPYQQLRSGATDMSFFQMPFIFILSGISIDLSNPRSTTRVGPRGVLLVYHRYLSS